MPQRYVFGIFLGNGADIKEQLLIFLGRRFKTASLFISVFVKVLDWSVFITLGILALISVKESWNAYSEGKTSWMLEQQPIPNQPTFGLCFGLSDTMLDSLWWYPKLGRDLNISFSHSPER